MDRAHSDIPGRYWTALLAAEGRPFQPRGGIFRLLGRPAAAGEVSFTRPLPPVGFSYLRSGSVPPRGGAEHHFNSRPVRPDGDEAFAPSRTMDDARGADDHTPSTEAPSPDSHAPGAPRTAGLTPPSGDIAEEASDPASGDWGRPGSADREAPPPDPSVGLQIPGRTRRDILRARTPQQRTLLSSDDNAADSRSPDSTSPDREKASSSAPRSGRDAFAASPDRRRSVAEAPRASRRSLRHEETNSSSSGPSFSLPSEDGPPHDDRRPDSTTPPTFEPAPPAQAPAMPSPAPRRSTPEEETRDESARRRPNRPDGKTGQGTSVERTPAAPPAVSPITDARRSTPGVPRALRKSSLLRSTHLRPLR